MGVRLFREARARLERHTGKGKKIAAALLPLWTIAWGVVSIASTLLKIERHLRPRPGHPTIGLRANLIPKGVGDMTAIPPLEVPNNKDIGYSTDLRDASGNPRTATLTWATDPPLGGPVSIVPALDRLTARGVTQGVGTSTVSVTDGTVTDTHFVTVVQAPPPPVGTINLSATIIDKTP